MAHNRSLACDLVQRLRVPHDGALDRLEMRARLIEESVLAAENESQRVHCATADNL